MNKLTIRKNILAALLIITVAIFIFVPKLLNADTLSGDPSGMSTGNASNISSAIAGAATVNEIADELGKVKIGLNFVWIMLSAFLIFFFQAGFAMVETGLTRAKNALHTMAMNLVVFLVGTIGFYILGFAIMMGGVGPLSSLGGTAVLNKELAIHGWGILGYKGFFLSGSTYDVAIFTMFFFQMVFMDTTCTIPTGAMAERVKLKAIVVSSFFVSMFYYPVYGNWVWGGGWLAQLGSKLGLGHGALDFAGSGVVHAMGGMIALTGAIVLGPRIGKFKKDGKPVAIAGHHIPMAIIGTIILFFGWFAFNAGSTLSGTDLRLGVVATNTMLAGAFGGFSAMLYMWIRYKKPDPTMTANGALAGLVAITAGCAFVSGVSAMIIGLIAGVLVCISVWFVENKLKIDDPVGAISVHGVNGVWGLLALGLFADGSYGSGINGVGGAVRGLFYGGTGQLWAQLISIAVVIIWGISTSWLFWKILDKIIKIRVKPLDEVAGLDLPEMGVLAYPDFLLSTSQGKDGIDLEPTGGKSK
ncbi:MAG: ammonium transporter [Actinobacteria bacterium]|nr:ammonium transporter [Cyanobacteriota bacterium]MCL5771325.1 ammonium transporter [Actinomycetota bacterium]